MIVSPNIYLIAASTLRNGINSFLQDSDRDWIQTHTARDAEQVIEFAGRICYMAFGEGNQSSRSNAEYILNLIASGHESVLEHVSWTLLFTGVSRALSHQLTRHRTGIAFSQLSQQYHDESNAEFVEPVGLSADPHALEAWHQAMKRAVASYRLLLRSNIDLPEASRKEQRRALRSAARSVLPNATATAIVVTANAREWRHILRVRGATPGDLEMRQVFSLVHAILADDAPAVFADFVSGVADDGWPAVRWVGGSNVTP